MTSTPDLTDRQWTPTFTETFVTADLDPTRWIPHYVPHWTTPERSAARYRLGTDGLELRIDADQPPWRPEEGELRISGIQSGTWSGPAGSSLGPHRHGPQPLVVRSPQASQGLFLPREGAMEATLKAELDHTTMLAFFLVGFEADSPDHSGEICVVELFGNAIGTESSELSLGIKAHHDPTLTDDMIRPTRALDATQWHTYRTKWNDAETRILVDGEQVFHAHQGVAYPMLPMLGLFEFPTSAERPPASYPKRGWVRDVRGFRHGA